jgi:hypothetical protein
MFLKNRGLFFPLPLTFTKSVKRTQFNATIMSFWPLKDKEAMVTEREYINFGNCGLKNSVTRFLTL